MLRKTVNPDQLLLQRFVESAMAPMPVDTNPVAADLAAVLRTWDPAARTLTLTFEPTERHMQGNGMVHGGVVATMLDFGVAFAAMAGTPRIAVTAALTVQYEAAVRAGVVSVRATVHRIGGRIAYASAEASAKGTDVLARATATLAVLD